MVMTKDRDCLHLLFKQGPPPQVIWLRMGNSSNQALQAVLLQISELAHVLVIGHPVVFEQIAEIAKLGEDVVGVAVA
jgi:predicted nuclease of predicted toxin-antitoxin system